MGLASANVCWAGHIFRLQGREGSNGNVPSPASSRERLAGFLFFVVSPACLPACLKAHDPWLPLSAGDPGVEAAQGHCEIPLIASLAGGGHGPVAGVFHEEAANCTVSGRTNSGRSKDQM